MPEFVGPLPSLHLARWLWLVPLVPLIGALRALLDGRLGGAWPGRAPRASHALPWVVSLAVLLAEAGELGEGGASLRGVLAPGWEVLHLGSLDLSVGLVLDGLSLLPAAISCACCAAGAAWAAASPGLSGGRRAGVLGAIHLGGVGVLLVTLADTLPASVIGFGLSSAAAGAGWMLLGGRSWLGARLAGAAAGAAGAGLLFWALAGAWTPSGYTLDPRPRLVALHAEGTKLAPVVRDDDDDDDRGRKVAPQISGARGFVTMAAMPGAKIYLDGSSTPLGRSPLVRAQVPAGVHQARVSPGPGSDDLEVPTFRVAEGAEVVIASAGGTVSPRDASELLGMTQNGARIGARERLASSGPPGGAALWVLLCFLAVAITSALPPSPGAEAGAALALSVPGALGGAYLLARAAQVVGLSGAAPGAAIAVGALASLGAGLVSLGAEGVSAITLALLAQVGLASAAACSGAVMASVSLTATAASAAGLALWGLASPASPSGRPAARLGAATLSLLPPLGGAFALLEAMRGLTSSGLAQPLAVGLAVAGAAGAVAASPSLARIGSGPAASKPEAGEPSGIAPSLLAAPLLLGCLLVGPLTASTLYQAPLAELIETARLPRPPGAGASVVPFLICAFALLASGVAWAGAKRPAPSWAGAPARAVERASSAWKHAGALLTSLGALLCRLDRAVEALAEGRPSPSEGPKAEKGAS